MRVPVLPAVALLLTLAACGRQTPAENRADQLDAAAGQSDPAAAPALENAADALRNGADVDPQAAMEQGGAAQADTTTSSRPSGLRPSADDMLVANRAEATQR